MCLQSGRESASKTRDRYQLDSCLIRVEPQQSHGLSAIAELLVRLEIVVD